MVSWYRRLIPAVAAIFLVLGTGAVPHAVGEEALLIPGATVFRWFNPVYPLFKYFFYPSIGNHFHDDDDPEVIDYSQNALVSDWAIRQGVQRTIAALAETDGEVVIIGESMGSMVASRVAAELADSEDPPSVDRIRFVLIAPPEAGIAEYFPEGAFIPILNYRVSRIEDSPYPTTIVIGEYDGWSDPPDRPWNLVSLLNAAMGAAFLHTFTSLIDPADVPAENITVETNSLGATVTTYLVPAENLPLTLVLRLILPGACVDALDEVLRPIIDAGYRRHDEPGDTRPYLSDGQIHWGDESQQALVESSGEGDAEAIASSDTARTSAESSTGQETPATDDPDGESADAVPASSPESGDEDATAPVTATQSASEVADGQGDGDAEATPAEPESDAATEDAEADDPVEDRGEADTAETDTAETDTAETETDDGIGAEQDPSNTGEGATGAVADDGPTSDDSGSAGQKDAAAGDTATAGSPSEASAPDHDQ